MLRFFARLAVLPLVIFSVALLLIRAQPYDDHELRELLLPEGCPAPCFMGIRPGVTTMDEALKLLEANKWVNHIEKASVFFDDDIINWTWSDQKPKWIDLASHGQLWSTQPSEKPVVDILTIYSYLPLGDILYVLGIPDVQSVSPAENSLDNAAYYMAFYDTGALSLQARQSCNTSEFFIPLIDLRLGIQLSSPYSIYVHSVRDIFRAC